MKSFLVMQLILVATGCAPHLLKPVEQYDLSSRRALYQLNVWQLQGRVAVVAEKDSFSAAVNWQHDYANDLIELAGPFGQGRVVIKISNNRVLVRRGNQSQVYQGNIDRIIARQLAVDLPVSGLRYWVLGLVAPQSEYRLMENGFEQHGWQIHYQQMERVGDEWMPRKFQIKSKLAKIKFVIDQWKLM